MSGQPGGHLKTVTEDGLVVIEKTFVRGPTSVVRRLGIQLGIVVVQIQFPIVILTTLLPGSSAYTLQGSLFTLKAKAPPTIVIMATHAKMIFAFFID